MRINITNTVGIHDHVLQNNVAVYPNPSNGIFTLNVNAPYQNIEMKFTILNNLGEIIYENVLAVGNQQQIDISDYAAGTYILKIVSENGFATKKLVIVE